ncbi:MAG: choice-of-anchor J domain-containing protein, partial [Bacteroidales bacterium]|nr:choice-of-anchor J domain-containing protein [Bacteroidales bacterium]
TEDFEHGLGGFTTVDSDGDGFNWIHHENGPSDKYEVKSGISSVYSESYDNVAISALHPDNWLITPLAKLDGEFSFWACGQDKKYHAETFGIFVTTGEATDVLNYVPVSPMYTTTHDMTKYTVDLSAYAGQTGYIAIRHYNSTDQFCLVVDDVTYTPANLTPESYNVYVDAALTSNTTQTAAELKELTVGGHVFAVTAVFSNNVESKPVTASLEVVSAIDEILNSGKSFTIYSIDGKRIQRQASDLKGATIINNKKVVLQ